MKIRSVARKILADLITPVSLFLKLRESTNQVILLESSDYSNKKDIFSFIAYNSLANIRIENDCLITNKQIKKDFDIMSEMNEFMNQFEIEGDHEVIKYLGIVGYTGFNSVKHFEKLKLNPSKEVEDIPALRYDFYRYLIVFDHFHEALYVVDNIPEGETEGLDDIVDIIQRQDHQTFSFKAVGEERSNMTDEDFKGMVSKGKEHCQRGDVFQIVLSRKFLQDFKGDEFNVYRALRSINPSPYLFYFDYGSFKIFGSSPEAQVIIREGIAELHPIAGTFKRTGDRIHDAAQAQLLIQDPKESAEHVMLVDLARNDLSRNCNKVTVNSFKEIQFFSHVIHLVSKVTGKIKFGTNHFQVYADTYPAGTLSGAPKVKAMELIHEYEPTARSFYGGGIGLIHFNGDLNHAIVIRSFLSQGGTLTRQAGAGIVIDSKEENELQEVTNKLEALKKAIVRAEKIA